ncbi:tape measure protein [Blautia hydrogenotrophica]|uniref:tape measure protein n=1 Tax=Blautia hydrogenotrophica TaxID=53443 RepID=UPI003AB86013
MADGYLNFDTKINESGFVQGISKLNSAAKSGVAAAGKALAGVTAALGAGVVAGVKYNATIEQYQTSFEVMTGSAEEAAKIVQRLTQIGAQTPFEMTGLAETTQLLMNYGFTADEAMDRMMMLGDISQGSADKMNRIATAYGQMSSAGKVQLEDIKQMIEAGFNPLQEISQTTGESMESLYDRISKGTISVDEITASMQRSTSEGGKYFQSMAKQSQTVSGQLSTLKDNAMQLLGSLTSGVSEVLGGDVLPAVNEMLGNLNNAFSESGFQGFLDELGNAIPVLQGVTDVIGNLAERLQSLSGEELSQIAQDAAGIGGAAAGFSVLADAIPAVGSAVGSVNGKISGAAEAVSGFADSLIAAGGKSAAFGNALKKVSSLSSVFLKSLTFAGGVGVVVAGLGLLYSAFGDQIDQILMLVQTQGPKIISDLTNGIVNALPGLIAQGSVMIQHLLQAITANIPALVSGGIQIVSTLVSGIAQQLPTLVPLALQMVLTFAMSLISNLPQLINSGMQLIAGLAEGLVNSIPLLVAAIPVLIQTLVSGFISNFTNFLTVGFELIATLASGIIKAVPDLLSLIPEIFKAFANAILETDWVAVGKQVLEAVIDGIKSIGSSIGGVIKELFTGGDETAKEEGKKTGEGYAKGVESAKGSASSSGAAVAQEAANSFSMGLNAGTENAVTAASNLGNAANTGLQLSNMPLAFSADAQAAADGVSSALNTGSFTSNFAAMNLGSAAKSGLQSSNMSGSFAMDAQAAVNGVTNTLNLNSGNALLAGQNVGANANTGLDLSNMGGNYSSEGTQAIAELIGAMSGGSGSVAGTAGDIGNAAGDSLAGSSLTPESTRLGTEAMNGLANAISSASGTLTSAGTQAGNSILQGLKSANIAQKSRTEGQNFAKALADAIKSGSGNVRGAASSLASAAINAVNSAGLNSSGYSAGTSFSAGLANGIRAGQGGVAAAAAAVAQAAVAAANANLKIHSPSRVAAEIGEMFDAGIGTGLMRGIGVVRAGVKDVADVMGADTKVALQRLQSRAKAGPVLPGNNSLGGLTRSTVDYQGILDEWEIRQRRLNRQRDERPIVLNGRNLNRAAKTPGGKIGGAISVS